jgi:hypothetical protein
MGASIILAVPFAAFAFLVVFPGFAFAPAFFPLRFFQDPQGFVKTPEEFREVIGEEDHRLTVKAA